jgi:hypothetical protein
MVSPAAPEGGPEEPVASWIESRWRARVAAGAVSALATTIVARPWSFGPDAVFAQGDTQFTLVSALHVLDALRDGRPWYAVPLSWPVAEGVLQSDWVAGAAVVGSPLFAIGVDPARVHVWLVLGMLWATTFVAARAAAAWLGEGPAAWLAGIAASVRASVRACAGESAVLGLGAGVRGCDHEPRRDVF